MAKRLSLPALLLPCVILSCTARSLEQPIAEVDTSCSEHFGVNLERNVDIVFMVDDSPSMAPLQAKLAASFPAFMKVLERVGLPNVHIGVISSDLGAGRLEPSQVRGCHFGGDQGKFQVAPRDACTVSGLAAGQNFISNINGNANYTGALPDVFSCIAKLGDEGCGFEHQFGSLLRALGADGHGGAPIENAGFLRPEALLAIILITNEDDCSAPLGSNVFDPTSQYVSDPLGPLSGFRCNYLGHRCAGAKPPLTSSATLNDCVSAEDGTLLRVADVVANLKGLKADPNKVLVAAIAGPPQPYVVTDDDKPNNDDPAGKWPMIQPSCTQPDGTFADPGVRIFQWVQAFGQNGTFESICGDSFTVPLENIAEKIGDRIDAGCISGTILDTTGAPWKEGSASPGPDCTVVQRTTNASGQPVSTTLPACAASPDRPCWRLEAGGAGKACRAGTHALGYLNYDPNSVHLDAHVECAMAPPTATQPRTCR
jgi:hypothetical protein